MYVFPLAHTQLVMTVRLFLDTKYLEVLGHCKLSQISKMCLGLLLIALNEKGRSSLACLKQFLQIF